MLALLMVLTGHGLAMASPVDAEKLKGQAIYRDGRLPSGAPLQATVQQGVTLSGGDAACAKCHRRSGWVAVKGAMRYAPLPDVCYFPGGDQRFAAGTSLVQGE